MVLRCSCLEAIIFTGSTGDLSQKLDCDHEPENASDQFAIKMFVKENGSEKIVGHLPREISRPTVSASERSSHTCRNIICEVQTFPFGTRWTRTIMHSICFNATQLY